MFEINNTSMSCLESIKSNKNISIRNANISNTFQRSPETDMVTVSRPKEVNKKRILLGVGAAIAVAVGVIYGVKNSQVKNIKNIQKAFQDTFMREDITIEQTREMMQRYKDIEKITDREEYAKALFEEAKKNYGLENNPIKLVLGHCPDSPNARGVCIGDNSAIFITPKCSREHMLNTMHHEFRHAKQNEYLGVDSQDMYEFLKNYTDTLTNEYKIDVDSLSKDEILLLTKKGMSDFFKSRESRVPARWKEWYTKCRKEFFNNKKENHLTYWCSFTEQDARKAGQTIDKYVKGKAFTFDGFFNL